MAWQAPVPGFVDRMGEDVSDSSRHHQNAALEVIRQKGRLS
jgi:hypothetical protein